MSSDRHPRSGGTYLACRIGTSVYLVTGEYADRFESNFGNVVLRSLELMAADQPFVAFQTSSEIALATSPADWSFCELADLSTSAGLDRADQGKLLAVIFRLVASSFGLRRDPVLKSVFQALVDLDGLARGKVVVHAIEATDTAICEVPTRLRLGSDSLVVAFADQLVLGSVEAVASVMGDDGGRKLAAVDCSTRLPQGRALAVTARGLAIADIDVRVHKDMREFHKEHSLSLPDATNLLAIHDRDARAALAAIARHDDALPSVALRSLGLWFEITHACSMPHGLFVSGWFRDPDKVLEEVLAIDHGLDDPSLRTHWMVVPAKTMIGGAEVAVSQFHAFLPRQDSVAVPSSIAFRLQLENGESHLAYMPDCTSDKRATRTTILDAVVGRTMPPEMLERIFRPAVAPIQQACNGEQAVAEVLDIGTPSARNVSLIIPLYRETRFMRSQLIGFNVDPYVRRNCQIVYVVDDPLIAQRVRNMLQCTPNVFELDIRLVVLERNGGYALANNFGVGEADGDHVVLMNSDIVPEKSGWLEPMLEKLGQLPGHSVIGPKLLYGDESMQHAGMYFFRLPSIGYWQNMHFFKGFGRDFPPANVERTVPAVTGALMLVRRSDFLDVGGFTADYVVGDYEDSDLCLKLRAAGGTCLYMPSVALWHFERQSMPDSDVDAGTTIYNRALHSAQWSEAIEALMSEVSEVRHSV